MTASTTTRSLKLLLLLMIAILPAGAMADYADIPENPNIADRSQYVADPAGLVPADAKARVNDMLYDLRRKSSCEVAAVVMPSIGDYTPAEFCEKTFTAWGLGKKDKDNGVLLLIDTGGRQAFIMTGYGAEGVLPDISCARIVNTRIVPAMKEGDLGRALTDATAAICSALTDPAAAEELRSGEADNFGGTDRLKAIDPDNLWVLCRWVAALAFLLALAVFIGDCLKSRHQKDNYDRAMVWRSHMPLYWGTALFSLGSALIFALLALWLYRGARNRRIKCPVCGTKMQKLDEEADNAFLSPSQDLEEKLGTIDYDVWRCPKCATVERFPYRLRQLRYTECPNCHTVAMRLKSDTILRQPTTRAKGLGVKTYECLFCHHQDHNNYDIPRKTDDAAAALAAGAILGSMSGRSGGGGGFGGGFGGGATGGGGGGGHW